MEVSVLIHKPLGALRPMRPIAAKEKDKHTCIHIRAVHTHTHSECVRSAVALCPGWHVILTTPGPLVPHIHPFLWVSFFKRLELVILTVFIATYGKAQVLKAPRLIGKALSVELACNVTDSAPT